MSTPDPWAAPEAPLVTTPAPLVPVAPDERIHALDVLRGFALLGIFLMNVEFFSKPMQDIERPGIDPAMHGLDYAADALVFFFVQNKFWILFSLLFGMGFAVMIERARKAGRAFVPVYLRRTAALLGIGAVHAVLVWSGDILVAYAVTALLMLLVRTTWHALAFSAHGEAKPLAPWKLAAAGVCSIGLAMGMVFLGLDSGPVTAQDAERHAAHVATEQRERDAAELAFAHGSYGDAVAQRAADTAEQFAPGQMLFTLAMTLGIFVIGMAILRSGAMEQPGVHRRALRRVRNMGLPLGFLLMAWSTWLGTGFAWHRFGVREALQVETYMLAGLVLAIAYGATVVLAQEGPRGAWLRRWLAPAGRMALTNYLLTSVIGTLTFYGYGLGWWGQVGRAWQMAYVVVVFSLQLLLSRWWLGRFRFGPVEWAWRAVTYWRRPPMRRAPAA